MYSLKFSSISNLTAARFAAAAMAEWISFSFDEQSADYINVIKAKEIVGWLTGPKYIGEFATSDIENIKGVCGIIELQGIQVPINAYEEELQSLGKEIFVSVDCSPDLFLNQTARLQKLAGQQVSYVFTGKYMAAYENFLREFAQQQNVYLGFDFESGIYQKLAQLFQPQGFQLMGENEDKPGLGDTESLNLQLDELLQLD